MKKYCYSLLGLLVVIAMASCSSSNNEEDIPQPGGETDTPGGENWEYINETFVATFGNGTTASRLSTAGFMSTAKMARR